MVKSVGVDFDGVIHAYSKGWHDGAIYDEPVKGAFSALHLLMRDFAVFVHTTRDPRPVADWITTWSNIPCAVQVNPGMEFWNVQGELLVTNRKLPAVAYIDDRGIRFENWDQALSDLERFEGASKAR